jgi:predicted GNAT family acetyltransferase
MKNEIQVVDWNKTLEQQAYELLYKYEETSLFLLSNLKMYGSKLTDDTYSGNFKCLVKSDNVVAVFALSKIGNLIMQTDRTEDYSEVIFKACMHEASQLKGIVGDWELAKPIWDYAKKQLPQLKEKLCAKEILFRIMLDDFVRADPAHNVRYLHAHDYPKWLPLIKAFSQEQNVDQGESDDDRRVRFLQEVKRESWFGLFLDKRLVSMAAFTANINQTSMVGSVYTLPEMRKMGLAKKVMQQLLFDGKNSKNLKKIVLFTGENNYPAISLYKSLGFTRIGYFGLLFGSYDSHG